MQVRIRAEGDVPPGAARLPEESDRFHVQLTNDPNYYVVDLRYANENLMETALFSLLRDAFLQGRQVRLAYQQGAARTIRNDTAAWVDGG